MCQNSCPFPHKLQESPDKCTPEQILECHGTTEGHPCEQKKDEVEKKEE